MAKEIQFELGHRSFQSEQQSVIHQAGIVDTIGIDYDRADEPTEFDQVVPIAAIPCQARRFDAEDRADLTSADFRHQALKAGAIHLTSAGPAKVVIDCSHVLEPKFSGSFSEVVLPALTFEIVQHLPRR